jgi:hypothetical protein
LLLLLLLLGARSENTRRGVSGRARRADRVSSGWARKGTGRDV